MKEFIAMAEQGLRSFFKDRINSLVTLNLIGFVIVIASLSHNLSQLENLKQKVDHRYFNLERSLQDIHNVEIETHKGRVVKKYN